MKEQLDSVMLRIMLKPIVISLQLFAVYVVLHGHYSPGGGFQGGVLLGSSLILSKLVRGADYHGFITLSKRAAVSLAAIGVLIFAWVAIMPFFLGADVLDYGALPLPVDEAQRRSLGILFIEVGVTVGVAAAIVSIFYTLYSEEEGDRDTPAIGGRGAT